MLDTAPNDAMRAYIEPVIERKQTELILRQVPVPYLRQVFPHVVGMLSSVVDRSDGRWTLEDMAGRFVRGEWQMWVVYDGEYRAVLATELFIEASGMKNARVVFCTGIWAKQWVGLIAQIEDWARDMGCRKLEMLARKGWARHLEDYKLTHVQLEKDLGNAGSV